jgi:glutaredoxin
MVRLYTIENCSYCSELKELLKNGGIEYQEVDVNKKENEAEFNALFEITKSNDVPQVKVGKQILIPHTSFTSIDECYNLTKKFLG